MYYKVVECPWCGNEVTAKGASGRKEIQKCHWCRRLFSATVVRVKGKGRMEVEAEDYTEPYRRTDGIYQKSVSGLEWGR